MQRSKESSQSKGQGQGQGKGRERERGVGMVEESSKLLLAVVKVLVDTKGAVR